MKITEKTRSTLRYCAAFVLIFGSVTIGERTNAVDSVNPYETFGGDTLRCVIGTGDENYGRNGFRTGFSYDLLRKFGSHVGAEVKISYPRAARHLQPLRRWRHHLEETRQFRVGDKQ